jgi:hypothetical protein
MNNDETNLKNNMLISFVFLWSRFDIILLISLFFSFPFHLLFIFVVESVRVRVRVRFLFFIYLRHLTKQTTICYCSLFIYAK